MTELELNDLCTKIYELCTNALNISEQVTDPVLRFEKLKPLSIKVVESSTKLIKITTILCAKEPEKAHVYSERMKTARNMWVDVVYAIGAVEKNKALINFLDKLAVEDIGKENLN